VLKQSEKKEVLLEEVYWHVEMEEVQEQEMKVSRQIEGLARLILVQRVSVSTNRYISRYVNCVNYGVVLIRGGKPDKHCPETDAPAFFYDAGDVLPLDGCVSNLLDRPLSQGIYYIIITLLMDF